MAISLPRSLAACIAMCCPVGAIAADDGQLDPGFNGSGVQTIGFEQPPEAPVPLSDSHEGFAMAVGPGRLYVAGRLLRNINNWAIGITRLRHDGSVDTAYGEQGRVIEDIVEGKNQVLDAALQSDGKLLVAGWVQSQVNPSGALLCRFLPSGARDAAFGDAQTPGCRVFADARFTSALLAQDDGRILVALRQYNAPSGNGAFLRRLLPDGSDDAGFAGKTLLDGAYVDATLYSLASTSGGHVVAAGFVDGLTPDGEEDVLLFRVDANGLPAPDPWPDGIKVVAVDGGSTAGRRSEFAMHVHAFPDGSLFIAGTATTDNNPLADPSLSYRPFVFKLGPDGEFDPMFGLLPHIYAPCSVPCNSEAYDAVVDADGRIVLAGFNRDISSNASEFAVTRILTNGMPDPSFGTAGTGTVEIDFALVDPAASNDQARAIGRDGDRLLLAGTAMVPGVDPGDPIHAAFAVARLDDGNEALRTVTPVVSGTGGSLSPSENVAVAHGDHAEFAILPDPGYVLNKIEGCGGEVYAGVDVETVYTTAAVTADCEVMASFVQKPPQVFSDGFEP